jgi:hypothetical protein
MKETIIIVASILAIVGNLPYIRDVLRNKIQPHPFTWLVWSIVSCIIFFGALAKGGGLGTIPILASEIFTVAIFILSLKHGFKNVKKVDVLFLAIALLGLIPWYLTKDPTVSVIIAVSIDLVAFIPTLRKTYLQPKTENYILYLMNVLRHILIMFSLDAYNIATTLHSIVMIVLNTVMTYFITIRGKRS